MAARPTTAQSVDLPDGRKLVRVLCEAEPVVNAAGEQWVQVMPLGPFVEARDGRTFQVSDALSAAAVSEVPMLIDWEHESESWGGSTRAAGWVEGLKVQHDDAGEFPRKGVWGRAQWTPEGKADVESKAYRFLSPVLLLDSETRDVQQIVSVALTNRPALHMQGLDNFRQRFAARFEPSEGAQTMNAQQRAALLTAFGLAAEATDEQIVTAARSAMATGAQTKEMCAALGGQLSEANAKIATLEKQIEESRKATFTAEVKATLDEATKAGKMTPAQRAGFEKLCATPESFATFKESVLPSLTVMGGPAPASAPPAAPSAPTSSPTEQLSQDVNANLTLRGMSPERIKAAQEYRARQRQLAALRDDA